MCIRDRIGADGAHVGQGDMPVRRARELLGPAALLGLSVNSPRELAEALSEDPGRDIVDYLGLGIYRSTTTKPDHAPAAGLPSIQALAAASPWPCLLYTSDHAVHPIWPGLARAVSGHWYRYCCRVAARPGS